MDTAGIAEEEFKTIAYVKSDGLLKDLQEYNVPHKVYNIRERDCLIFDTAG